MSTYKIYYQKSEYMRDLMMGWDWLLDENPELAMSLASSIVATHVYLKEVQAGNMDEVFRMMQGEIWSPNGEANDMILEKGLRHTSMSVGDIIYDCEVEAYYFVDSLGFKQIPEVE